MANEKRTIQSFFAPVAKKAKPVAEAPAAANEASAKEVEAKTKEAPGSSSSIPDAQRQRAEQNKQVAMSKVLQRKAMEVAAEAAAKGEPPNLDDLLVEETWRGALDGEFGKEYWSSLKKFLAKEYGSGAKVFPAPGNIFRAFNTCPMERVKVVILGQDPYHDDGQAMGLSFSVPKGWKVPSSLINIYKELGTDLGCKKPTHGDLDKWSTQGVLMLNASLTVRAHQANLTQRRAGRASPTPLSERWPSSARDWCFCSGEKRSGEGASDRQGRRTSHTQEPASLGSLRTQGFLRLQALLAGKQFYREERRSSHRLANR